MDKNLLSRIGLDPARNPAVLDTASWDSEKIRIYLGRIHDNFWEDVMQALKSGKEFPSNPNITFFHDSLACTEKGNYVLAKFMDGQHILLGTARPFTETLCRIEGERYTLNIYNVDTPTITQYFLMVDASKMPRALGPIPRLGIGTRMSTTQWPAIFSAMEKKGFSANAIQNSIREICLLEEILNAKECETNYLFSFGNITSGHTGATFEGLWLYGVLEALKRKKGPGYGADADHLKVKPGKDGLKGTKKIIAAAQHYTFFTIDVSPILNYDVFWEKKHSQLLPESGKFQEIRSFHMGKRSVNGFSYSIDVNTLERLIVKYQSAFDALEELNVFILRLKGKEPYDLELSIDEIPGGYNVFDHLTQESELLFIVAESSRRGIKLTHLAPNFGVEKGVDYRGTGGYAELQRRIGALHRIAESSGAILDCHSGDDLSSKTRRVFQKSTNGGIHFKVSPRLQELFGECLYELCPSVFKTWWDSTFQHVIEEAGRGSSTAHKDLEEFSLGNNRNLSPTAKLFIHYSFASVGKRDDSGKFMIRDQFYSLPDEFYGMYSQRLENYLCSLAEDLFL